MVVSSALLAASLASSAGLAGSYRVEVRSTSSHEQLRLNARLGKGYLVLKRDGRFDICADLEQSGFWRLEGNQVVLATDGFMQIRWPVSSDTLKKRWPKNELEGFVLQMTPQGALILPSEVKGRKAAVFWPMPQRSTRELLRISESDDPTPEQSEARALLLDVAQDDWQPLLDVVSSPKENLNLRIWAAVILTSVRSPLSKERAAELIPRISVPENRKMEPNLRSALGFSITRFPTPRAVDLLLNAVADNNASSWVAARAIEALADPRHSSVILKWLENSPSDQRGPYFRALAGMAAPEGLPIARAHVSDASVDPQDEAHGYIARVSTDKAEVHKSLRFLMEVAMSPNPFRDSDAVRLIRESARSEALPYLIMILESDSQPDARAGAAEALGTLGDSRAVPALIEALNRRVNFEASPQESHVRQSAAESLSTLQELRAQRRLEPTPPPPKLPAPAKKHSSPSRWR